MAQHRGHCMALHGYDMAQPSPCQHLHHSSASCAYKPMPYMHTWTPYMHMHAHMQSPCTHRHACAHPSVSHGGNRALNPSATRLGWVKKLAERRKIPPNPRKTPVTGCTEQNLHIRHQKISTSTVPTACYHRNPTITVCHHHKSPWFLINETTSRCSASSYCHAQTWWIIPEVLFFHPKKPSQGDGVAALCAQLALKANMGLWRPGPDTTVMGTR